MAKVVKAKWGIGSDKPEDLPDFLSNDEILEKNGDKLPRGRFRLRVKEITVVKNKNDDDMLKVYCEVDETDKAKASYNGYFVPTNQNITEQGKPFLLKFLRALGATWDDFMNNTRQTPETTIEAAKILSIGSVKFTTGKVYATALLSIRQYQGEDQTDIARWVPKSSDSDEEELEDEDTSEEAEDDEDVDLEDADADDEDEADDEDMSDEEAELREELETLTLTALKKRAKENGAKVADYKGLDEAGVIDLIVEQEIEEEEEDEEEDADDAEAELREELSGLTIAQLKARCRKNKRKLAEFKTAKEPALIEMIVEDELEGDSNEPPF